MAKPSDDLTWATDANFSSGPANGQPTKVNPPGWPDVLQGFVPGNAITAELVNKALNLIGSWTGWLLAGSSAGAADAHIVETDADGKAVLAQLQVSTHKIKLADETVNNSDTLQNDNELAGIAVLVGSYKAELFLIINGHTDGDFKFAFAGTATAGGIGVGTMYDAIGNTFAAADTLWNTTVSAEPLTTTAGDHYLHLRGTVTFTVAGTYTLQWAQNAAHASNLLVKVGSYLFLDPA